MYYSPYHTIRKLSEVYYGPERHRVIKRFGEVYNISSGVSSLLMPDLYKKLLEDEFRSDLFYRWYTGAEGSEIAICSVLFFENLLAGKGSFKSVFSKENAVISVGSTALITLFFEYFGKTAKDKKVLIIGLNYFLFSHCCLENNLIPIEVISSSRSQTIPDIEELIDTVHKEKPGLIVLSVPGNPTGEFYKEGELESLFNALSETGTFLMLDRVCLDELSYDNFYLNLTELVVRQGIQDRAFLVNSLSKSRNMAGMRLGYGLGNANAVEYIKNRNYLLMFSPPATGTLVITYDMLLRSIAYVLNNKNTIDTSILNENSDKAFAKIISLFKYYMSISCPLTPGGNDTKKRISKYLPADNVIEEQLMTVVSHIEGQYQAIKQNIELTIQVLEEFIHDIILPAHGYNFVIKIDKLSGDQVQDALSLFREWGVEILTEKCFRLTAYSGEAESSIKNEPYWIRISAAASTAWFKAAMEQFCNSLRCI